LVDAYQMIVLKRQLDSVVQGNVSRSAVGLSGECDGGGQ
jgi:hypothetical protein